MKKLSMKNNDFKKIIKAIIGYFIMSIGINALYKSNFGSDPISLFYDGVHSVLNISYGNAANIVNIIGLIIIFLLAKKYFHIGTVLNAILLGVFINISSIIFVNLNPNLFIRILLLIFGILLLAFGNGLVINTNLGFPWVDGIVKVISEKTNREYAHIRIIFDAAFTISGFLLGGVFNFGTILAVITLGPIIQFASSFWSKVLPQNKLS
ncbi:MAG: hypothetical protein Q4P29_02520 [Tissierellia bacterium]|nr:hypothetical protein [Tissierellia bacterium]